MRFVLFYHSLRSDWNHGNAHFLRGVARELLARGHWVTVLEPVDGWSAANLVAEQGEAALHGYRAAYLELDSELYALESVDLDRILDGADVVLVHEWNEPELVRRIGEHRAATASYKLLFHDTHHRAATAPDEIARYDLRNYDGILAFGSVIRDVYRDRGWAEQVWTWHEAADVRLFKPDPDRTPSDDFVWVGNWGDDERDRELREFLIEPVQRLGISATVYGVRYPAQAREALARASIRYAGWLPNIRAPEVFARHRVTMHVPRRPYVAALPGIPTIRVFEALACGIPLVSAPWDDAERLFTPGDDYLVARDGAEMQRQLAAVIAEPALARSLAEHGLRTILARHTCAHRVDELLDIVQQLRPRARASLQPLTA